MPTLLDKISYAELLTHYLPRGAWYVVRAFKDWAFAGVLEEHLPVTKKDYEDTKKLNESGYDVFWTANAVKEERGSSTHELTNYAWANAVYTDLDIPADADREESKAELAGHIMFADPQPSFVVETRNGYHLYWFTNPTLEEFKKIQQGIYEAWKCHYADSAAKKELLLMRVPGFKQYKHGEVFMPEIRMELCARNNDGSFKYYSAQDLLRFFPVSEKIKEVKRRKKIKKAPALKLFKNTSDIFRYVKSLDQVEVFERCNGSRLTGGETFSLTQMRGGKVQIRKNGKPVPCWIDTNINAIFSNNIKGHYGITEFAQFYGMELQEIAEELSKLFPEHKNVANGTSV